MSYPSLSILLPCHNEEKLLTRQLASILPQLEDVDELILLDDGSKDGTLKIMKEVACANVKLFANHEGSGVNEAYNLCARLATKQWVLGAAGNDIVQSEGIRKWREAVKECPQARICFGQIWQEPRLQWFKQPTFIPQEWIVDVWKKFHGQDTHGAACFTRRDTWEPGYSCGEWMGDWWLAWKITARFGCLFMPHIVSMLGGKPGFSSNHGNDERYNAAIDEIRKEAESEDCKDIRDKILAYQDICGFLNHRENFKFHRGRRLVHK